MGQPQGSKGTPLSAKIIWLEQRVETLDKDLEKAYANQCMHRSIVGDDHGYLYCKTHRELHATKATLYSLMKYLPDEWRDDLGFCQGSKSVLSEVLEEIQSAIAKFPTWPTDPLHALAVLGEEFGELTKATLQLTYEPHKTSPEELRKEAVQTAAMALRFLQSLSVYQFKECDQHKQGVI